MEAQKKVKMGPSAVFILGLVFTILGSLFTVVSLVTGIFFYRMLGQIFPSAIFSGFGLLFLIPGILMLHVHFKKKKILQAVVDGGRYFFAEITEVETCYNVNINGRHPIRLIAKMTDPYGNLHLFKSPNCNLPYLSDLIGRQVKVYAEQGNLDHYYVDLDSVLSTVYEHG